MTADERYMAQTPYPVFLDISVCRVLVVGGGSVAERKIRSLIPCASDITVVAPQVTDFIARLGEEGRVALVRRAFEQEDARDMHLVFCAADDPSANAAAAKAARQSGAIVNRADDPEDCDFAVPAVVSRGPLQIAVSTSGASPALARRIRREIEQMYDEGYGVCVGLIGEVRSLIMDRITDPAARRRLAQRLADDDVVTACLGRPTPDAESIYSMIVSKEDDAPCR